MSDLFPQAVARGHPEADFQRSVVQYLRWSLPDDGMAFHIPNGGMRHKKAQAILAGLGVRAGIPDIEIVHRGSAYFIELKALRGSLSEAQRQMHRKLAYCGAPIIVCKSLSCVEESLREYGIPLRGHAQ